MHIKSADLVVTVIVIDLLEVAFVFRRRVWEVEERVIFNTKYDVTV